MSLSRSDINNGAEMFIFLNSCPSFDLKLYWRAIYGKQSRISMLASNIINKANQNFKIKAGKIFAKLSSMLAFQHISSQSEELKNDSKNISLAKNIVDVKGERKSFWFLFYKVFNIGLSHR